MMTDSILPFYINKNSVRGRLVRLGDEARKLLEKHNYPTLINGYLIEMMTVAAVLATDVKYKGIFTLQIIGKNSPVSLMVVDITSDGEFRACAKFKHADIEKFTSHNERPKPYELFGNGYMLFSADLEASEERYQAVVDLNGDTLSDCVQHFFRQSEQIATALMSFVNTKSTDIIGASLLIQRMPDIGNPSLEKIEDDADLWFTNVSLLATLKKDEILDENLDSDKLLYRLFHECDLVCNQTKPLSFHCYCSRQRLEEVLSRFSQDDLAEMTVDGKISAECDFCSEVYEFSPKDFKGN